MLVVIVVIAEISDYTVIQRICKICVGILGLCKIFFIVNFIDSIHCMGIFLYFRREVYSILKAEGILLPRYAVLNRDPNKPQGKNCWNGLDWGLWFNHWLNADIKPVLMLCILPSISPHIQSMAENFLVSEKLNQTPVCFDIWTCIHGLVYMESNSIVCI